jgi:hypothetical protein
LQVSLNFNWLLQQYYFFAHIVGYLTRNILRVYLADIVTEETAGLIVVSGRHPGACVEHHLHALLLVERVVGLAAQPVDGVVVEKRVGRAPLEVERAATVAARSPVAPARPLHIR